MVGKKKERMGKEGKKTNNNNNETKTTTTKPKQQQKTKKNPTNQQKRRWKNSGLKEQPLASLIAKVHGSKPWNNLGKVAELP